MRSVNLIKNFVVSLMLDEINQAERANRVRRCVPFSFSSAYMPTKVVDIMSKKVNS